MKDFVIFNLYHLLFYNPWVNYMYKFCTKKHRNSEVIWILEANFSHGQANRTAHKLSASKIELFHWSTGHSKHL